MCPYSERSRDRPLAQPPVRICRGRYGPGRDSTRSFLGGGQGLGPPPASLNRTARLCTDMARSGRVDIPVGFGGLAEQRDEGRGDLQHGCRWPFEGRTLPPVRCKVTLANMYKSPPGQAVPLLCAEELVELESFGQTLHRPAGHIFIREGEETDFALLIQKGHVKVVVGKPPRTVAIRCNGEMVGEMAAVRRRPRSASVIALDDVQVLRLPADEWLKFLYKNPRAMHAQLLAVDERLEQATRKIVDSDLAVEQRLAKALIELVESGIGEPNEGSVVLRFSQQDLATLTGSSLDSVKKIVRAFKNSRIIGTGRQTTIVLDLAFLRKIADGKLTAAP